MLELSAYPSPLSATPSLVLEPTPSSSTAAAAEKSPALLQSAITRSLQRLQQLLTGPDASAGRFEKLTSEEALSNLKTISGALQSLAEHPGLLSSISRRTGWRYLRIKTDEAIQSLPVREEAVAAVRELTGLLSRELRTRAA